MSFNQNDSEKNMIHLGNYEEFFILYLDNELSDEQMKMVDEFLLLHPDLQAEFEILAGTKLPGEEFSFNKAELFSDSMKTNGVNDDLLLYIDQELPADMDKVVELELAANADYKLQYEVLLRTKLDPSEKLLYPNKEDLYRRTERRIGFKPWMRIAAAAIVIAAMGVVYFNSDPSSEIIPEGVSNNKLPVNNNNVKGDPKNINKEITPALPGNNDKITTQNFVADANNTSETKENKTDSQDEQNPEKIKDDGMMAVNTPVEESPSSLTLERTPLYTHAVSGSEEEHKQIFSNLAVTPSLQHRNTDEASITEPVSENKGSVKGFLRKATRLMEKRTGIDPTNDGELLIGAFAVKLK